MKKNEKTVEKNYIYNLGYQILVMIVPLITTPYVSRVLGADGVGIYSFTSSIVSYFVLFGNFGIATYGQLCIAAERENKKRMTEEFWGIYFTRMFLMLICMAVYLLYILFQKQYRTMYLVLILQLAASAVDISWLLQGLEEFKKIVLRNAVVKLLGVALIFLLVKEKKDLYIYATIMQGAVLIGNLSIYAFLREFLLPVSAKEIRIFKHIRPSIQYFIPTIATSVYMLLDKSMIGWITHSELENGYYEQAQKIEQMAVTVVTSLSVVTLPRMTLLFKQKKKEEMVQRLHGSIRFILWISLPMAAGIAGIAPNLIPWFLGKGYEPCVNLLCIFSVLIIVIGLNNAVGKQVLMPIGKQKEYNYAVICGAMVNVVCNVFLIPALQSVGAAIASVAAETVILFVFLKYSSEYITAKIIIKYAMKNMIASTVTGIAVGYSCRYFASSLVGLVLQVVMGMLCYIVVLILLRDPFTIEQIRKYRTILKK